MRRMIWLYRAGLLLTIVVLFSMGNSYVSLQEEEITVEGREVLDKPVRVLQLSDFHGKTFSNNQRNLRLMFDRLDYDVVALTGNVLGEKARDFRFIEPMLKYFQEQGKPVLFVTGSHDVDNPLYSEFTQLLETYGTVMLDNANYAYSDATGKTSVSFVGLSDPNVTDISTSQPIVTGYLEEAQNADNITVLLANRPTLIEQFRGKADIILSGNALGGQVRLPFIGGLYAMDQGWFPEYDYGLFTETDSTGGQTQMYVSKGLGSTIIPGRLFNFPGVALLTIQPD